MLDSNSNDISCTCPDCRRGLVNKSHQTLHKRFHDPLGSIESYAIFQVSKTPLAEVRLGSDGASVRSDSPSGEDSNSLLHGWNLEFEPIITLHELRSAQLMDVEEKTLVESKAVVDEPKPVKKKSKKKSKKKKKKPDEEEKTLVVEKKASPEKKVEEKKPDAEKKTEPAHPKETPFTCDADCLYFGDDMEVVEGDIYKSLIIPSEKDTETRIENELSFDQY